MDYSTINRPFESYRWRWGASTPTEGLNVPEVFAGCLQVLATNEGKRPSDEDVYYGLQEIERDLSYLNPPTLARPPARNLFRNSGQYWKTVGVLETTRGGIRITPLGRAYATGAITRSEFAAITVKSVQFPDSQLDPERVVEDWDKAELRIKPLELILAIILKLHFTVSDQGFLTAEELVDVVIPLAGHGFDFGVISDSILEFRTNRSVFNGMWTADVEANDIRIAREFLLFLYYYDFLGQRASSDSGTPSTNRTEEYFVYDEQVEALQNLLAIDFSTLSSEYEFNAIQTAVELDKSTKVVDAARERKLVKILERPNQAKFRKDVMVAGQGTCLLSQVTTKEALQACHIVPVKNHGSDDVSNGLVLRTDLHTLYDQGHIRITETGKVILSEYLRSDPYYVNMIPEKIVLPGYVSLEAIRLRNQYLM